MQLEQTYYIFYQVFTFNKKLTVKDKNRNAIEIKVD